MGPLEKLKGLIKETWACINEGGAPRSAVWRPDTGFRKAVETHANSNADIEGGLFIDDLKEFYDAMDAFNATRPEKMCFSLMLHEDIAEGLEAKATGAQQTMLGLASVGPLALERNGRVYEGRWFSDMVYNSGFAFKQNGVETKFLCGLEKKAEFEPFVTKLLNPPPSYPHPVIPRLV